MDLFRLSASEFFEQIEASRRALLQYYNSSALQHLSYSLTFGLVFVGLLYERIEFAEIFAEQYVVANLVFFCIFNLLLALGFHNIGRTMFYGSSSYEVMNVMPDAERIFSEKTIMFQLHERTSELVREKRFVKHFYYTNWSIIFSAFVIPFIVELLFGLIIPLEVIIVPS